MSLFERIILKDVQGFQNLTAEEKERDLTLFKHKYVALWLTRLFMNSMIPSVISLFLCITNFIICIVFDGAIVSIVFFTTLPIFAFTSVINMIIMHKSKFKKKTSEEIGYWLIEKFQNLWLLNQKVISFKDWKVIKKRNKVLYDKARSESCNHKCYFTTYGIANTLENPDIKVLWICIETLNQKCGHSVIVRNNQIYDSNLRRTYNRDEYLKAFKAEVFKEYYIEEYMSQANMQQTHFTFLDWEEFGEWCKVRNAVRND